MSHFESKNDFSSQADIENGKTFSEYWRMLVKHWKLCIVFVVVFFTVGYVYSQFFKSKEYQAYGTCMVLADKSEEETVTSDDVNYSLILLATVNTFMQDDPVINAVTSDLNDSGFSVSNYDVSNMLTVEPSNYTSSSKSLYLDISATSSNGDLAVAIVNSCINNSIELTNTIEEYSFFKDTIVVTSEANQAYDVSTSSLLICILSTSAGFFLYVILSIFLELTNVYCIEKKELESLTNEKVISVIPDYSKNKNKNKLKNLLPFCKNKKSEKVGLIEDFNSPAGEGIQQLQANLSFYNLHGDLQVIGVTSSSRSEGKSTTICNLAKLYAEKGSKVCIVNIDIRRPSVHRLLKVENKIGIVEYVRGETDLEHIIQHVGNLDVISSGTINPFPTKIIESTEMKRLIERLRSRYEYIFVDTPPVLTVSDTLFAIPFTDGFLITCSQHETRKGSLKTTVETLKNMDCNIVGIVMNKVTEFSKDYIDHYKYYRYNKSTYSKD